MNKGESLARLEATVGQELRRALPPAGIPADISDRIRERLVGVSRLEGMGTVLPFPRRRGRTVLRWTAAVAAAAVIALSGFGSGLFGQKDGANAPANLAGPWYFGPSAFAGTSEIPTELTGTRNQVSFRLDTALPDLPERAPVYNLTFGKDGIAGGSFYEVESDPGSLSGQPAIGREAAERRAIDWLKERGFYPQGPLEVTTFVSAEQPQYASVYIFPGPGHEFYSMNDNPKIWVALNGEKVFSMMRTWPEAMTGTLSVGLKTAAEAWADLQANNGVWIGSSVAEGGMDLPPDPVLTVKSVELSRAWARSTDERFYMIPVVVFHSEVTDAQGRVRNVFALVSAIRAD